MNEINETDSLLSPKEWEVYSHLSEAWNTFIELDELFVTDREDFARHINAIKNIVMSRPVARELARQGVFGYQKEQG